MMNENGLTNEEAEKRLSKYGENVFKRETNTALKVFVRQFKNSLVYLFIVAIIISFLLHDITDGIVMTVILFLNASLGFIQEYRSEKAVEKLSKFISRQILVVRNGKEEVIDEKLLVPGDVIIVREGDIVPADAKLIEANNLSVNESILTGESAPIEKSIGKDKTSLLFTGSTIEKGEGKAIVTATGNNSELGKIANLSVATQKTTQYEKSLQDFSNFLMRIILLTLGVIFIGKLAITHDFSHITTLFLFLVALAVAVIPEALPVIAVVTLSEGALKLARKNVVVKRLSSLEDLGNVNLLCTDKTGTLTENKLRVRGVFAEDVELFLKFAYATIETRGIKKKKFESSYDLAFENYIPLEVKEKVKYWEQVKNLPFDPEARRRRVIIKNVESNKHYLVEVGSVETLLHISKSKEGKKYLAAITKDGKKGIRHLGISYKEISLGNNFQILKHEDNLKFLGYVQLIDPLRETSKRTIELAEKLGLTIKILTGDSKEVAEFVGQEIGLLKEKDNIITGDEIQNLTDTDLKARLENCPIFARVTPEQKYKIISLLKGNYVVGYQGDGINDAPSLKLADVSIAVDTATDVAKDSSDIVLLKKDLEVIVNGIKYGRSIFVNINKYIKHTMVGNLGTFFSLAIVYLIAHDLPQLPIQLLLGNLIQDIPLITIYSDNVDLSEIGKPQKYNIHSIMLLSLFLGTFTAIYDFIYFRVVGFRANSITETSLFLFLTFSQLIIILSVRNKTHIWEGRKPSNLVIGSIVFFSIIAILVAYISPINRLFSFTSLPFSTLGVIIAISFIFILILDYIKVLYFKVIQKHQWTNLH